MAEVNAGLEQEVTPLRIITSVLLPVLPLLEGFRYTGGNMWEGGRIYNPEDGIKCRCKPWLDGGDRLKARGYVGFSLPDRTETWIR